MDFIIMKSIDKPWLFWIGLSFISVVALVAVFAIVEPEARLTGTSPEGVQLIQVGQSTYAEHCAACHGTDLQGEPSWRSRGPDGLLPAPPHDQTGHTWHHSDEILFSIVKKGVGEAVGLEDYETNMPSFSDVLTDNEIWAVLAFITSTWPPEIQLRRQDIQSRDTN